MKKELYYVAHPDLEDIDGILETNGSKTIHVYSVVDGKIRFDFYVQCSLSKNSVEAIQEDPIYIELGGDDKFLLIDL